MYVLNDIRTTTHPNQNLAFRRVTIEPGSYTGESLASAIQKALQFDNTVESALPFFANALYYDVKFDQQTQQIRISKAPPKAPSVFESFQILSDTEAERLGPQFTVYGNNTIVPALVDGAPRSINGVLGKRWRNSKPSCPDDMDFKNYRFDARQIRSAEKPHSR